MCVCFGFYFILFSKNKKKMKRIEKRQKIIIKHRDNFETEFLLKRLDKIHFYRLIHNFHGSRNLIAHSHLTECTDLYSTENTSSLLLLPLKNSFGYECQLFLTTQIFPTKKELVQKKNNFSYGDAIFQQINKYIERQIE